jgi:hypothetical protein
MNNLSLLYAGFCIIICPLFYSACNEDEDELPAITMEGRNTFGCLVNGELFLPNGPLGQSGLHAEISNYRDTAGLIIYASNTAANKVLTVSIFDTPMLQTGKPYDLRDSSFQVQYIDYDNSKNCTYETVEEGYITLSKFELTENIISGTFEIKIFSKNCNDSVNLEQGRFDIAEIVRLNLMTLTQSIRLSGIEGKEETG